MAFIQYHKQKFYVEGGFDTVDFDPNIVIGKICDNVTDFDRAFIHGMVDHYIRKILFLESVFVIVDRVLNEQVRQTKEQEYNDTTTYLLSRPSFKVVNGYGEGVVVEFLFITSERSMFNRIPNPYDRGRIGEPDELPRILTL